MVKYTKEEQMYEKYGHRKSDYCPIICEEYEKIVCYSYGNIDGCADETNILCTNCKEKLPN